MDNYKNKLKKEVWRKEKYYQIAKEGLEQSSHEGEKVLKDYAMNVNSILDLGCGEGSRLNLLSEGKYAIGLDISKTAIRLAKENYPRVNFIQADLENIPLKGDSFELIYSAYVLEHLTKPEKVLSEGLRLLTNGGCLILIAPNYGSPNRASPPFKGSRLLKLIIGFVEDFLIFFGLKKDLEWHRVTPISNSSKYDIDWDTTIEPYVNTLKVFLKNNKIEIEYLTTCWSEELKNAKIHQKVFRILGLLGIYPFYMWGPHLLVVGRKNEN